MAFLFCCRGPKSYSPPFIPSDSERLRTLQPSSFISLALPTDTVPHRPATGIDEHQALRDIFGASPTSHRGYQAAAKSSGSSDANFMLGRESPIRSRTKAKQSLDKLGQNIRLRLSESRLSNHSSRKSTKDLKGTRDMQSMKDVKSTTDMKSTETVVRSKLLPNDHTSTGLEDLLISRTVSEGGYDSDARGIQTPSWTKASAGSVSVSPEYGSNILTTLNMSPSKRSTSLPRTPRVDAKNVRSPSDVDRTPSTTSKMYAKNHVLKPSQHGKRQVIVRATSNPKQPMTPKQDSLSAVLQLQANESPTDVLRRLSVALANGKFKLPDTPELKAMRMPSIVDAMPDWRLSFAAPKRASSLHRNDQEVRQALKTLSDRVEKVRTDSINNGWTSDEKHVSLISNLDPTLLQYISRYSEEDTNTLPYELASPTRANDKDGEVFKDTAAADTTSHADAGRLLDSTRAQQSHDDQKLDTSSSHDRGHRSNSSGLESEKESVHLFDMRISQRLASTSILPTLSPSSTNLGSNQYFTDRSSQSLGKTDRFPSFIGQTSTEHVRRPSDPSTRRLFEPDRSVRGRKMHPKWTTAMTVGTINSDRVIQSADENPGDDRLAHESEAGHEDSSVRKLSSQRARSNSRPGTSSSAIAGGPGTQDLPPDQRHNSMNEVMSNDAPGKANLPRSESNTRGKASKFSEHFGHQKKPTKNKMSSDGANTLANEGMSMVEFLTTIEPGIDRNEKMSEAESAGKLNERVRLSIGKMRERTAGRDLDAASEVSPRGGMNDGSLVGDNMGKVAARHIHAADEPTILNPQARNECTTNTWERALKSARLDSSLGGADRKPESSFRQLHRDESRVRRRSSESRHSREHIMEKPTTLPIRRNRSLSPATSALSLPPRESFSLDRHQSCYVGAKKPLGRSLSPAQIFTKSKKKSFLDIAHLTTHNRQANTTKTAKSSPTNTMRRDFHPWARFPSHTRLERNGSAKANDGITTRDFSTPPPLPPPTRPIDMSTWSSSSSPHASKLSLMTQPDNMGAHTPASWRFLPFSHGRKKSRSLNFAVLNHQGYARKEMDQDQGRAKQEEQGKNKSSVLTLTRSLARWGGGIYRSYSSDVRRRLPAGHRSEGSKEERRRAAFPELEAVSALDGVDEARAQMEQWEGFDEEERWRWKWLAERQKLNRVTLGESPEARRTIHPIARCGSDRWSERKQSSFDRRTMETEAQTPTRPRPRALMTGSSGRRKGNDAWADIYQACVTKDDDYDNNAPHPSRDLGSSAPPLLLFLRSPSSTTSSAKTNPTEADPGIAESSPSSYPDLTPPSPPPPTEEDGYNSCSIETSDDDADMATQRLPSLPTDLAPPPSSPSSNTLRRLISPELRDSTLDFRSQLLEEERRVREGLLLASAF